MTADASWTLDELVARVNDWCDEHRLAPANGQSAEQLSSRTLRYYRTMGLLAAPHSGGGRGYGELHELQLCSIRVLQAQGLPLRRIQSLLYGRSEADLRKVLAHGIAAAPANAWSPALNAAEDWRVVPLDPALWLILRQGRKIRPDQIARIQAILGEDTELPLEPERKTKR